MLFTNRDAHRIARHQLGNDITLEVTKHLLARLSDQSFDVSSHGDITATRKRAHTGMKLDIREGKDGGRGGKRAHGAGNYIPL